MRTRNEEENGDNFYPKDAAVTFDDLYVELPDDDTFHIGQCYTDTAAVTLACKKCGGREFNVASADYYTAIRCVKCEWEALVHAG